MSLHAGVGKVDISVRSMWMLLAYASGMLERLRGSEVEAIAAGRRDADLLDALVRVLVDSTERRLRDNLLPTSVAREDALHRVRGRIDHLATARGRLLESGRIACRFSELSVDRPRYRLLRATLVRAAGVVSDAHVRTRAIAVARALEIAGVSAMQVTRPELSREQFGRVDRADRDLVDLCSLIEACAVPFHETGSHRLPTIQRDEHALRALFEKAALGYFRHAHADQWSATASRWAWPSSGDVDLLPELRTDVTLDRRGQGRRVIVECKFTSLLTTGPHGKTVLRSGYVQQLHAYLSTSARAEVSGVLLGPLLDGQLPLDLRLQLDGRSLRVLTIDLTDSPAAIRQAWDAIVEEV